MKKYTLIKDARVPELNTHTSHLSDILIKNGPPSVIESIMPNISAPEDCEIYDAAGHYALPAFIDLHVHLREPGFNAKEDIASGTRAAAAGGYRGVVAMPNTNPVTDCVPALEYVLGRAKETGSCEVYPAAAITKGQKGLETVDFDALHSAGAVAFSDDGRPVVSSAVLRAAMKKCAEKGYLIISHCEDMSLAEGGVVNEGRISRLLGVKGIPDSAESLCVARDVLLAEETGCRLHVAHVSTAQSLEVIRNAKARGVRVTCETCPHYFSLSEEDVPFYGANAKMNPPLRSKEDVKAVIDAICDGTVDCISTDHAPHTEAEKRRGLKDAPNGITGLQTAFAAAVTYLVMPGYIDIFRLAELMSLNPAKIIGAENRGVAVGARADIAIVSPGREFVVTKSMLKSKSFNTPFLGLSLYGLNETVFIDGVRKF